MLRPEIDKPHEFILCRQLVREDVAKKVGFPSHMVEANEVDDVVQTVEGVPIDL